MERPADFYLATGVSYHEQHTIKTTLVVAFTEQVGHHLRVFVAGVVQARQA